MIESPAHEKYPLAIRVLHWLMAVMIIGLLAVGLIMTDLAKDNPYRSSLFALHKSFGLTVLMLAVLRLALKLKNGGPPFPSIIPRIQKLLAHLGHWALYGFMFALPVSGYIMSSSFGLPVKWFGFAVPKLLKPDRTRGEWAADFHAYAAYALIGMLVLHIGAVILHYVKERINLLKRMF
jgi:cytochrome b561